MADDIKRKLSLSGIGVDNAAKEASDLAKNPAIKDKLPEIPNAVETVIKKEVLEPNALLLGKDVKAKENVQGTENVQKDEDANDYTPPSPRGPI